MGTTIGRKIRVETRMQEIIDLSGEIHLWKIVMSVSGGMPMP